MKTNTFAALTAVAVCLVLYLFLPNRPTGSMGRGKSPESVYQTIRARKVIKAAYAVGAPLFVIDPNTKQMSGIFYDVVQGAAKKLGLEVSWTDEVGYGEMIQGLDAHRYDIVGSGVWINGARGKDADFTIPVYYDSVFAYTRKDDTRFDNDRSLLNSPAYIISTMDGELAASIAATDFPQARTSALPQSTDFTQMILNVVNHKADVVFLALAPAELYKVQNPGSIRVIPWDRPLRVFPVAILLPKGSYELKQSFDYALIEMLTNGEVEAILKKYEKVANSFTRTAPPYLTTETRR